MTPRQADKLIASGKPVTLFNRFHNETIQEIVLIRRDRRNVYGADGQKFDRGELELASTSCHI